MSAFKTNISRAWQGVPGAKLAGFLVLVYSILTWEFTRFLTDWLTPLSSHPASMPTHTLSPHTFIWILLLNLLLYALASQATARIGLARSQGEAISLRGLFRPTRQTFSIFLATAILLIMTSLLGMFCFFSVTLLLAFFVKSLGALRMGVLIMIPIGIAIAWLSIPLFAFIPFAIENRNARFYNAWLHILRTVKSYRPSIVGYILFTIFANLLGALCLMVGLLWSQPFSANLLAVVYREGQAHKN